MTKALEKIADREYAGGYGRDIVCHRCGTQCVLPPQVRLDETVCVGCVQRLADLDAAAPGWPRAVRAVAAWADKAAVRGPGYGIVSCPHCDVACVVEVGETARTGCAACLMPLGVRPLIREDLASRSRLVTNASLFVEDDALGRDFGGWPFVDLTSCMLFPGEPG